MTAQSQTKKNGLRSRRDTGSGFTLIELLIVIGIIVILVALAVVVGTRVTEGGRERSTANILRVLDESRGAWERNADKPLPSVVEIQPANSNREPMAFPIIDARIESNDYTAAAWPSMVYYTALVTRDASVSPIFEQLDNSFVKPTNAPPPGFDGETEGWEAPALTLTDAWGRPLRVVHPAYHGGYGDYWDAGNDRMNTQRDTFRVSIPNGRGGGLEIDFRRSWRPFDPADPNRRDAWVGDSDEGMSMGGTPYFYSAGGDGDPGTRGDNVYSTVPRFPAETRDFKE